MRPTVAVRCLSGWICRPVDVLLRFSRIRIHQSSYSSFPLERMPPPSRGIKSNAFNHDAVPSYDLSPSPAGRMGGGAACGIWRPSINRNIITTAATTATAGAAAGGPPLASAPSFRRSTTPSCWCRPPPTPAAAAVGGLGQWRAFGHRSGTPQWRHRSVNTLRV